MSQAIQLLDSDYDNIKYKNEHYINIFIT